MLRKKQKMTDEKKGLPALEFDNEMPYDDVINEVRVKTGVPFNRTILARIAIEEYIGKRTAANGKVDIQAVAAPYAKLKLANETKAMKAKLMALEEEYRQYK
jgi:hypothetical protein